MTLLKLLILSLKSTNKIHFSFRKVSDVKNWIIFTIPNIDEIEIKTLRSELRLEFKVGIVCTHIVL